MRSSAIYFRMLVIEFLFFLYFVSFKVICVSSFITNNIKYFKIVNINIECLIRLFKTKQKNNKEE